MLPSPHVNSKRAKANYVMRHAVCSECALLQNTIFYAFLNLKALFLSISKQIESTLTANFNEPGWSHAMRIKGKYIFLTPQCQRKGIPRLRSFESSIVNNEILISYSTKMYHSC